MHFVQKKKKFWEWFKAGIHRYWILPHWVSLSGYSYENSDANIKCDSKTQELASVVRYE